MSSEVHLKSEFTKSDSAEWVSLNSLNILFKNFGYSSTKLGKLKSSISVIMCKAVTIIGWWYVLKDLSIIGTNGSNFEINSF